MTEYSTGSGCIQTTPEDFAAYNIDQLNIASKDIVIIHNI